MSTPAVPPADDPDQRSPLPLYAAGAITGIEGVAVAGYGLWGGVAALTDAAARAGGQSGGHPGGAVLTTVLLVGIGVLLVVVGAGLGKSRRWARAPAVVGQILFGAWGYDLINRGEQGVGFAAVGVAIACIVLIFRRSSTARLQREDPDA